MFPYNYIVIRKLFNRAGYLGTPDAEALIAMRKAHSLCSSQGIALDDVSSFVDQETLDQIIKLPQHQFLTQIADLQIALDDAQARIVAQAEVIADLRRSEAANIPNIADLRQSEQTYVSTIIALQAGKDVDASTIAALQTEIASLAEALVGQQEAFAAASTVAIKPVVEPATTLIEEPLVEITVRRRAPAKRAASTGVRRSARMTVELNESMTDTSANEAPEPDTSFDNRLWSLAEWARFHALAALGRATSSIARTLSREFSRVITATGVGEMRRERWLAPGYGLA